MIRTPLLGLAALPLAGLAACTSGDGATPWRPGLTYATPRAPTERGLLDRRGLIHAHSVYSHDACDNMPVKEGVRDPVCFEDFRRGLCQSKHDFVMLSDHGESFIDTEFPEALLHRPDRGDVLVERGRGPVGSWAACPGEATRALILGGTETAFMALGLEGHAAPDRAGRHAVYGDPSAESMAAVHAVNGVAIAQHTEDWTPAQLTAVPFDGFEMYNLHANTVLRAGNVLEYVVRLSQMDPKLPDPNLLMLGIFVEDERYLKTWGAVLSSGARRFTTMGTDCHRNTFQALTPDGERVDSYRRMMIWFSNHLLLRPEADGAWDDRHLKEALRAGRLYGAFEVLGFPLGFDFHAEQGGQVLEMGAEVPLAARPLLKVRPPAVQGLDPAVRPPALEVRVLRAIAEGWETVASGPGALDFAPTRPGAYRAEVRMTPYHLAGLLGDYAPAVLQGSLPWIYANAIYVR